MAVRRSYVCKMPDISTRHFEVASLRGSWCDKAAFWLAMKSGDNAASHSHLDIGTFVLEAGGRRFAIDLAPDDDYALPGYFSPDRRPGYYRISTAGHNTLLVDEANQPATARAQLIDLRSGPDVSRIAGGGQVFASCVDGGSIVELHKSCPKAASVVMCIMLAG
jgi:hypothetical protein